MGSFNKRYKLDYICFCLSWFIYIFRTACPRICDLVPNSNILTIIQFSLLLVCIFLKRYTYKQLVCIMIMEIILIMSYSKSNNYQMLLLFNNIFAFKDLEFKKMLKIDISFKTVFLLLNFICIFLGIIENSFSYRNGIYRYDMGFYNPNTFSSIVTSIVIEFVYLKEFKEKGRKYECILLVITAIILNNLCQSRGSTYILIALALLLIFEKSRISKKILIYMPTVFTILSFRLVDMFNKGEALAVKLNELLSTRLFCASNYLNDYAINLWGNNIIKYEKWIGYMQTIDISYIASPLINGVIVFILFMIMYHLFLWKVIKSNNSMLIKIMFVICIYGFIEKTAFVLSSNIFLLLIYEYVFKEKNISKVKEIE